MIKRTIKQQAYDGLKLTGNILLGFGTFFVLMCGVGSILYPTRIPRILGFALAIAATAFMVKTMRRWAQYFPGFISLGLINALVTLSRGRTIDGSRPVPRMTAISGLVIIVLSLAASRRFERQSLSVIDRIALLLFLYWIGWGLVAGSVSPAIDLSFAIIASGGLVIAWVIDHSRRARRPAAHNHEQAVT
jgi:hypothetical protein